MRHATAILIAASMTAAAAHAVAFHEPAAPPVPAPTPGAPPIAVPADVKVAGRDVPAPKRTRFVSPVFPLEAQAAGQRGIVILELVIDAAGKVLTADVLRSVPPFDEAALTAARQWEYEVTKVDGKPVPVRLTVPITFALKLPDMTREAGIPELRQGASPGFPPGARGPAKVVADVSLLPDGTVAEAAIREGESPYAEAMLQTLRTWRFASEADAPPVAFQVRAEFSPGPPPKIELKLSGLRQAERPAPAPTPVPTPVAVAAAPLPAVPSPVAPSPAAPPPAVPSPAPLATPNPAAASPLPPRPTPNGPGTAVASGPTTAPPVAQPVPAPPVSATPAPPAAATPAPTVAPTPAPDGVRPSPPAPTPPPVEVIPGGPARTTAAPDPTAPGAVPTPAPPPEPGVSAVRDVALGPGVPDLTRGRRPVAPPLARMSSLSGAVQIQFSVDASGASSIQSVNGPDLLKEAARQAVATWTFRRTSAERVYLVAVFNYEGDKAQAEVRRAD
ncbi:MAG TPA: TonB family protein [Vicinamibacteria bacterium]|nr:TonB family protein [Vicinamibacteria bacterium]